MTFSSNTFKTMSRGLTGGCASTDSPPAAIRTLTLSQPATAVLLDSLAAAVKGTAHLPEHTPALALLFCWLALSLVWTGRCHGAGWAGWEQRFAGAGVGLGAETGLSMAGLGRAGMADASGDSALCSGRGKGLFRWTGWTLWRLSSPDVSCCRNGRFLETLLCCLSCRTLELFFPALHF